MRACSVTYEKHALSLIIVDNARSNKLEHTGCKIKKIVNHELITRKMRSDNIRMESIKYWQLFDDSGWTND